MSVELWDRCLDRLEHELTAQQFNTWIRPLQATRNEETLRLLAPNRFVLDWVRERYADRIQQLLSEIDTNGRARLEFAVGSTNAATPATTSSPVTAASPPVATEGGRRGAAASRLQGDFTFETFVEGKSNQLARAASLQVAANPGTGYNPLFICGGVGLGKTHLMHAIGNQIKATDSEANVIYLRSERFVHEMVKALQHNTINEFKRFYRSVDALLIDDIQFLAGKERSQEEFFHTFNALLEGRQQIVLTCDRYPKEVEGLEERLKSRFGWGSR